jgi:hypothetical protein
MDGNAVCPELLNVFGHLQQVGNISATSISQSGNFVDVYA